jgi:hypothetical protein
MTINSMLNMRRLLSDSVLRRACRRSLATCPESSGLSRGSSAKFNVMLALICHAVGTVVDIRISFFRPEFAAAARGGTATRDHCRAFDVTLSVFWPIAVRSRTKILPFHVRVQLRARLDKARQLYSPGVLQAALRWPGVNDARFISPADQAAVGRTPASPEEGTGTTSRGNDRVPRSLPPATGSSASPPSAR